MYNGAMLCTVLIKQDKMYSATGLIHPQWNLLNYSFICSSLFLKRGSLEKSSLYKRHSLASPRALRQMCALAPTTEPSSQGPQDLDCLDYDNPSLHDWSCSEHLNSWLLSVPRIDSLEWQYWFKMGDMKIHPTVSVRAGYCQCSPKSITFDSQRPNLSRFDFLIPYDRVQYLSCISNFACILKRLSEK